MCFAIYLVFVNVEHSDNIKDEIKSGTSLR